MLMVVLTMLGMYGIIVGVIIAIIGLISLIALKPKRKRLITIGFTMLLASILLFASGYYDAFVNMQNLPVGTYVAESSSPGGSYTLKFYEVDGGATVAPAIRGEVHYNGMQRQDKTIYWNEGDSGPSVRWIDYHTVSIDGHVLNVLTDTYDFRHNPWF